MITDGSVVRLMVRLPNWVGDVVMTLPSLQALHTAGFALHCFGRPWAQDLLAACPWPVSVAPRGVVSGYQAYRGQRGCRALLFTNSLGTAMAARWAGLRAIGYRGDGRSCLLYRSLPRRSTGHEVASYWRLAAYAHRVWLPTSPWPVAPPDTCRLPVAEGHEQQAQAALERAGITSSYVVLVCGAAGTIADQSKIWPAWTEFDAALNKRGICVVACPGPGEEGLFRQRLPYAILLHNVRLGAYAAVLRQASMVIANDSGPMHMAAAVQTPTLGVFGVSDPARTGPRGQAVVGDAHQWPSVETVLTAYESMMQKNDDPLASHHG